MSTSAGTLTIDLQASIARLETDVKKAAKTVEGSMHQIDEAVEATKVALELLGIALGVKELVEFVKRSFEAANALGDMADNIHIATNDLAKFEYAASFAGLATEQATMLLEKQNVALGDAVLKGGPAREAIDRLGLSAQALAQMSPDKAFGNIADSLNRVQNQAQKAAIAHDIFGKSAQGAFALMAEGSKGLAEAGNQAERIGIALSNIDNARLTQTNNAMNRIGEVLKGIGNTIAVGLAPYLKALSDSFVDSAEKADGWKVSILDGVEKVVRAVYFLADVFRYLQIGWKVLEVAFQTLVDGIMTGIYQIDKGLTAVINLVPGLSAKPSDDLRVWALATNAVLADTTKELVNIANAPMPSAGIDEFFKKIREESDKAAKQLAAERDERNKVGGKTVAFFDQDAFEAELSLQVAALSKSLQTQSEIIHSSYTERKLFLDEALNNNVISQMDHDQLMERLELEHQAKLGDAHAQGILERQKLDQMTGQQQLAFYAGQLQQITAGAAQHNLAMFRLNQAAGITNAIISANVAATKALEWGWPLGPVFAGIIWAAAAVNINAIRSAHFGGGSAGGGGGGSVSIPNVSAPATQAQQTPQQQSSVNLYISGNVMTQDFVDTVIVPALQHATNNKDVVIFNSNSRQAREAVPV